MRKFATRPAVRWIAIAATVINIEIHLALALNHWREMPYIGLLFVAGAALLGAVAIGLWLDPDGERVVAWIGGSIVSAGEIVLFVLSRTVGLPGDYRETWAETPEDFFGLLSLLAESIFIACAAYSLTRQSKPNLARRQRRQQQM